MGNKIIGSVTQTGDATGAGSTQSIDFKMTMPQKSAPAGGASSAGTASGGLMNLLAINGFA